MATTSPAHAAVQSHVPPHYGPQLPRPDCTAHAGTQLPEPLHGCALQDLAAAQQAIAALQSIALPLGSGKPCKPPKNTLPP